MKSTKRLNIEEKCGCYFMNMTNINDVDPNLLIINELLSLVNQLCMKFILIKNETHRILFLIA